jgi:hypothetical protein
MVSPVHRNVHEPAQRRIAALASEGLLPEGPMPQLVAERAMDGHWIATDYFRLCFPKAFRLERMSSAQRMPGSRKPNE